MAELPHQTACLKRYPPGSQNLLAFLDTRLGKSKTCIWWAKPYTHSQPNHVLLLSPKTCHIDWTSELQHQRHFVLDGPKKKREALLDDLGVDMWVLSTYQAAMATDTILEVEWDVVIADESTNFKNPKSKVAKFMRRLRARARRTAILAAVPNPQHPLELFEQMAFCYGGEWMGCKSYWQFKFKYSKQQGFDTVVPPKQAAAIHAALHRDAFVMTRAQAGYADRKVYLPRYGDLDPYAAEAQRFIQENWELPQPCPRKPTTIQKIVTAIWLRQLAGGHLPGRLFPCWKYARLLEEWKEARGPMVVWAEFTKEIDRAVRVLGEFGVQVLALTGASKDRRGVVEWFRKSSRGVLVIQTTVGRFGLDLSCADTEVYLSCGYSFLNRKQSEDRLVHPLKDRPIRVVDLVTRSSADGAVRSLLKDRKADVQYFLSRMGMSPYRG